MALFRPSPHVERLVVGLGNPGPAYEGTPHNIGYRVIEELARRHGVPRARRGFDGRAAEGLIRGRSVLPPRKAVEEVAAEGEEALEAAEAAAEPELVGRKEEEAAED